MRVISGHCRGKKLIPLSGQTIRPTSDRAKEAVFNILGPKVKKARVLDLFAGTGALGIEALSRGADHAVFIDQSCDTLCQNLKLCRCEDLARAISQDILKGVLAETLAGLQFDLVFIDPPYGKGFIEDSLHQDGFTGLLKENAIIIAEHSWKESLQIKVSSLDIYRQKKYSKTIISFIQKI
jgi:16S rRNA (guanine966-N2)-methyltransferase